MRSRIGWTWAASVGAAVAVAVTVSVVTTHAEASALAFPRSGRVRIEATSAANPLSKTVTARCPAGTRVYGASAYTTGAPGHVLLQSVAPDPKLTTVTVKATGETADFWSVTAVAICGSAAAKVQRVELRTEPNQNSPKMAIARCPQGARLYGLGGEITGAQGAAVLTMLERYFGESARVEAQVRTMNNDFAWGVTAYAICGTPLPGMVSAEVYSPRLGSPGNSISPKTATAYCPIGTRLLGVGGLIIGDGQFATIQSIRPAVSLTSVTATAVEGSPFPDDWHLVAQAVCAP